MAEVKNAFIKSKMNLDLDARLVPQGEYRQGFNIQVSKSEGDDVGALENVLGNALLPQGNFQALNSGATGLQAIGHVVNPANNMVYIFLTNNTGTAYNSGADNFIYAYDTLNQTAIKLVEGLFLNFSTQNPIYGINIVENLLFWTDNRNQPRKININKTLGYYTTEDHISVAKFAPYEAINLYQESSIAGQYETTMKDVVSLAVPKINAADANPPTNPYLQTDTGGNPNYAGDPDYLEDKFVRFSYRFKFEDNEYSALAPFTQECFIPKQDGYFYAEDEDAAFRSTVVSFMENKVNEITLNIPLPKAIDGSAITGATLNNILKVTEIDIIYKESDAQAVQVVDTLSVTNQLFQTTHTGSTISYTYQSLKPYKTLPEADLIRVYDKVPVKAFSQEISGNRVIYGNFQDKHTPLFQDLNGQLTPQLDYEVGAFDKSNFNLAAGTTSKVEYPNSTLKQNRNYQVGIIVSDRYGRSSTVLLSKLLEKATLDPSGNFAASTHYHPYRNDADTPVASWPGDALKILFNSPITTPSPIPAGSGIPGLYIGSGNNYNPLGWYSYKVVVKQFEQDYYNVYLPGILNGPPAGVTDLNDTENEVGFITLINDNINKVPRDLSEVGPEQKQFRSSVQLFGRVTPNFVSATFPSYNEQFFPSIQSNTVITIGEVADVLGEDVTGPSATTITNLYDSKSNPLIARISQIDSLPIGSAAKAGAYPFQLAVFETEPTESRLDIYYETSTSGLISELNTAIETTTNVVTGATGNTTVDFNENQSHANGNVDILPSTAGAGWAPVDITSLGEAVNQDLPANRLTASIASVTSLSDEGDKSTFFTVINVPSNGQPYNNQDQNTWYRYKIQSTKDFYYSLEAGTEKVYNITVNFTTAAGESAGSAGFEVPLANTSPIFKTYTIPNQPTVNIDPVPSNLTLQHTAGATGILATFTGVNGTADTSLNTNDLSWSITSPANQTIFSINADGELSTTEDLTGPYPITITLTDAGGPTDAANLQLTVLFGNEALNTEFGSTSKYGFGIANSGGESGALYFVGGTNALINAAGSTPLPGVSSISNDDIRAPYSGLQLSNNVNEVTVSGGGETKVLDSVPDCASFYMLNKNQNAMAIQSSANATTLDQSQAGLRQGTAFIGVEINFNQLNVGLEGLTTDDYPLLMYPIYLQYRPFGGGNNWVTATDIEGKPTNFGGSQINRDAFDSGGSVGGHGIINKRDLPYYFQSTRVNSSSFTTDILNTACLEANTQAKALNGETQNAIARKTFVIGKSPYAGVSDKFGDYRLIVRYPWGIKSSNGSDNPIVVGYGSSECPADGFNIISGLVNANVFFGDFYYPAAYGGSNIYSYQYRVSNNAQNTAQLASTGSANQTLFAREWHMKYVTKFYIDADLTQPWVPDNAGWFQYVAGSNSTDINAVYGTDYSNTSSTGNPGLTQNIHRRWVAYFDSTGLKSLANSNYPSLAMQYQPW
jgi:hypothetical protein